MALIPRVSLSLALLTACETAPPAPAGVYSEFLAYDRLEGELPALAVHGTTLAVAVPSDRIGDASLASLLRAAEGEGVAVRLWLVLPIDQGYWPNEANLDVFAAEVTRLLDWIEAEDLVAEGIVYDLEPAYAYSEQLRAAFADSIGTVATLMQTHQDAAAFEASRARLASHVREVQARGYLAQAVTYPQVIDDLEDGDDDLQDALDIPVRDVGFDEVSFMVYQTVIAEGVGGAWIGPGLVRSFANDAVAHFGDRATIALGIVGSATIVELDGPLYDAPSTLADDVAAARSAGIARVEVYSLDGMVELGDPREWLDATQSGAEEFPIPTQARIVRGAAAGLDAMLD